MSYQAQKKSRVKLYAAIFALLSVIGLACWILQLTQGLQLTNLNNFSTWGLYIICFMVFTGIAAGSLIFTSSAYLFQGMADYKPYTRVSSFVGAICGVLAAGLFIIVDIGNPDRAWYIITKAHIASPVFWDTLVLSSYVIIGIFFTRQLILVQEGKKEEKSLRALSLIAFIAGLMVMVTSFIFVMQVGRPMWHNPVQPISFLAAAMIAALSLLIIVFALLNKTGYIQISSAALHKLGRLTAAFLLFELFVALGETAIGLYEGTGEEAEIVHFLVSGKGAPFFWVQMAAIVAGLVLFIKQHSKTAATVTGAGISIFAVLMIKYNLIQAQLLNPPITYAGPPGFDVGQAAVYLPSGVEIGIAVGITALGSLLVLIGLNKLNLGIRPAQSPTVRYDQQNSIHS